MLIPFSLLRSSSMRFTRNSPLAALFPPSGPQARRRPSPRTAFLPSGFRSTPPCQVPSQPNLRGGFLKSKGDLRREASSRLSHLQPEKPISPRTLANILVSSCSWNPSTCALSPAAPAIPPPPPPPNAMILRQVVSYLSLHESFFFSLFELYPLLQHPPSPPPSSPTLHCPKPPSAGFFFASSWMLRNVNVHTFPISRSFPSAPALWPLSYFPDNYY